MSTTELLRREWVAFRRPGRLIALAAAALVILGLGLLSAFGTHAACPGPCPAVPVDRDGAVVSDGFWFVHRDLGREGSITVRLAEMTGTITYPPPNHDRIVSGLVPWAKAGIIIKDGVRQGSPYAALMMTGSHGVRFQYDYRHDVAGSTGNAPRWLRLARSGDSVTAAESPDGARWHTVGTARLTGLPDTVQVGLFATSPGDLTLREIALGGTIEEVRFTQAVGVFDHVTVEGGATGAWRSEPVGEMNHTDWERFHNASGAVEKDGTITVSGTGDIGPRGEGGVRTISNLLFGLVIALAVIVVVAARYGARTARESLPDVTPGVATLAARAAIVGAATLVTALLAIGILLPVGIAVLKSHSVSTHLPALTGVRLTAGIAVVLALCAAFAFGLGVWLRRGWAAIVAGLALVVVPYGVAVVPLLPDAVAGWLLRLTPAAGFAVQQTQVAYPQVTAHYAASAGYFPLPAWAGIAVLIGYTMVVFVVARRGRG
jgi:hypothetical protein